MRKPVFGFSNRSDTIKPGCAATEDDKRLQFLDLEKRGIAISIYRKMGSKMDMMMMMMMM